MFDLISIAYAQAPGAAEQGSGAWISFVPILLMVFIFYFLLIRPSQKREKDRKKMIESIQKGDKVLTAGGMYGVVINIKDDENIVVLKIGEATKVEFTKNAIQAKIS